jgi:hypothetical protein
MRLAQVCAGCGATLTALRAPPEAVYGLKLIICPGCATRCIRRGNAVRRAWRRAVRVVWAGSVLLAQLALATMLLIFWIGVSRRLQHMVMGWWWNRARSSAGEWWWRQWESERWVLVSMLVVLPMATGLWLTACLTHWKRSTVWLAWAGMTMGVVSVGMIPGRLARLVATWTKPGDAGYWDPVTWNEWLVRAAIVMGLLGLALGGIPLGWMFRRAYDVRRSRRFRKRLAKARARKRST